MLDSLYNFTPEDRLEESAGYFVELVYALLHFPLLTRFGGTHGGRDAITNL